MTFFDTLLSVLASLSIFTEVLTLIIGILRGIGVAV